MADDGVIAKAPKFPLIRVPEVEIQTLDTTAQDRVLRATAWERRGAFLAQAREALRPSEVRAADLDDYDPTKGTLRVNKTVQGARIDARVAHTKSRTVRVKKIWDPQLLEWLDWQATPERRLRGENALFPNPRATARNRAKRWTVTGLEREWRRACKRTDVDYVPLQQGTGHSILTTLGQVLPERVLRDFSRHPDGRSLDRYSKPRATKTAIVRALPGPSPVPSLSNGARGRGGFRRRRRRVADRAGGAEGSRTPDLVNAIHALSQLSYSPTGRGGYPAGFAAQEPTRGFASGEASEEAVGMLRPAPEWRNRQTQGTQNPPARKGRVGSTPTSGTGRLRAPEARFTVGGTQLGSRAERVRICALPARRRPWQANRVPSGAGRGEERKCTRACGGSPCGASS